MNFADNWARVFVVITFLTFGEAQIIGGIVPNLIAFVPASSMDQLLILDTTSERIIGESIRRFCE